MIESQILRWFSCLGAMLCLAAPSALAQLYVAEPFEDTVAFSGLMAPTAVRFASDGRVFVSEKRGKIKVFENLEDSEPEVFADLGVNVNSFGDRGLVGLAIHPDLETHPYVYVLYTYDAPPGETAPVWNDECPDPPGFNVDGCVVSGRLSRLAITPGRGLGGEEEVLLEGNWCQQFASHSVGHLAFGPDGALYVSAGEGASFAAPDYGQFGGSLPGTPTPRNPCGDPPVPVGGVQTPPDAEGGALRSQDLRTSGDPVAFNGTMLRVDPETGKALPDNPLFGGSVPDDDRVIAYGLRNPYRFTVHPESGELWIGDVGWSRFEEINRIVDPTDEIVENFGWPCFEGRGAQPRFQVEGLRVCEELYAEPEAVTPPFFSYLHMQPPDPERCGDGNPNAAAITGLTFYPGGDFPVAYDGALIFADYLRRCIWAMFEGANGTVDPTTVTTLVAQLNLVVDLTVGPDGALYYVEIVEGTVHRVGLASDYLFADSFESGDFAAWTAVVP